MLPKDTPKTPEAPATPLTEMLQKAGFGAMPGFGTDWMETMAIMGRDMLSFTAARMEQDLQMQKDLLHAKGFAEIQHIQARFFQKAMDDYAAEAARLMGMGKTLVHEPSTCSATPL